MKIILYKKLIVYFIFLFLPAFQINANNKKNHQSIVIFTSLNNEKSMQFLTEIIMSLEKNENGLSKNVNSLFYGYTNIFLADAYNKKKAYLKAASAIKRAFFYIDGSAEYYRRDWRLIYLRLRMDAFTPKYLGRCVVALKDSESLLLSGEVSLQLHPMIRYMHARALMNCDKKIAAKLIIKQLIEEEGESKKIALFGFKSVPPWLDIEKNFIIKPLFLESD